MKKLLMASLLASACALTWATLLPLSNEAKAKAAEAAAKTAWDGKVDAYKLCKSQDKTAASYFAAAKSAGKETKPPAEAPACADPGAFVYLLSEAAKPIEASGAHSPTTLAISPPSSKRPDADVNPAKKP
ncbi:MAG: hypothetical protein HHJ16_09055 [Polaromonas sp.]|uniref:hypothetical protein n=1 Tax=Polaromonas sp. TaxID=1869339 RepID=UPI00182C29F4|nr:hypothetical protein [Polaromonas sp.]NMM10408.1 hypothetical protein [Polaromonas sp.]